MINLEQSLGLRIKITTISDENVTGTIYSYCPGSQLITLQTQSNTFKQNISQQQINYRIIKTSFIKNLQLLTSVKSIKSKKSLSNYNKISPKISAVSTEAIQHKLVKCIEKHQHDIRTINPKVSYMGQEIFNKLYKTLPNVSWEGKSIIVLNEIKVNDPYKEKSIELLDSNSGAADLVLKIINGFWESFETQRKGG